MPSPQPPLSNRQVHDRFAPEHALRYDAVALGWAAAYYGAWALYVLGWLPGWGFVGLGVIALLRNFNALHESFHAMDRGAHPMRWARWISISMAPLQLGYRELQRNHRHHHRHEGEPGDPDRYLLTGSPLWALLMALTQPEQSVLRYVRRHGLDARLTATLIAHGMLWAGLALVSPTWEHFLMYNLTARLGNTLAWWIFDYWLHRVELYGRLEALPMPRLIAGAWALLFSRANLRGVRHHYLHHRYPFVPDDDLPALAQALAQHEPDS